MNRKWMVFALLTATVGLGFGLLYAPTIGLTLWRIGPVFWGTFPASPRQVQAFLAKHQVQPLLIEEVANEATVILYRTPDDMGFYILWDNGVPFQPDDRPGMQLVATEDYLPKHRPANAPLSALVGRSHMTEIIGITINDPQLLPKAKRAKIVFSDGTSVTVPIDHQEATIFSRPTSTGRHNYTSVTLYDDADQAVVTFKP